MNRRALLLTVNAGSSSLKLALYDEAGLLRKAALAVERIGSASARPGLEPGTNALKGCVRKGKVRDFAQLASRDDSSAIALAQILAQQRNSASPILASNSATRQTYTS